MSEEAHSNETDTERSEAVPQGQHGTATPEVGGERPAPPGSPSRSDRRVRHLTVIVAVLIVVMLPVTVGVVTYLRPPVVSGDGIATVSPALGGADAPGDVEADMVSDPRWVRPTWAESVPGVTAFELAAGGDVPYANGRHRPSLAITCVDGHTDIHLTTGGTAPIDPQTSGHVVTLTFDDRTAQSQQWVAASDQRALFAPDALRMAAQLAAANRLRFGFTHYMTGAVVVEFDLRGADDVILSMVEPCAWEEHS